MYQVHSTIDKLRTTMQAWLDPISTWSTEDAAFVHTKRVELLYRGFATGTASSLLIAAFMIAALWGRIAPEMLLGWLAAFCVLTLLRTLLVRRYYESTQAPHRLYIWENWFAAGAAAAGTLWGVTPWLFIPHGDETAVMLVVFFLAGVSSGSSAVLAPSRRTVILFLFPALLPLVGWMFWSGGKAYLFMGGATLLHIAVLMTVARLAQTKIWNTVRTGLENERLHGSIAAERQVAEEREKTVTRLTELERENALFRCMVEGARDLAMIVHDPADHDRIIYANNAACQHFETDWATLQTWYTRDFYPQCDNEMEADISARLYKGETVIIESEHRTATGALNPVEVVLHPLEMDSKRLVVSYVRDIRTRRAAEAQRLQLEAAMARRTIEEHYLDLVEALPDYVMRLDAQGRYVYINPLALRGSGRKENTVLGKTVVEIGVTGTHESDMQLHEAAMTCFASGEAHAYEAWWSVADGHKCFEIRHIPEKDEAGQVVSVLGIARDITERVKVDNALHFVAQRGWAANGEPFLTAMVRYLGETLDVDYVIVDKLAESAGDAETVALFAKGEILPNLRYNLIGTPCENVMGGGLCCYPRDIQPLFPQDSMLVEMGVESYIGLPLWDSAGQPIGLIAVMDGKPTTDGNAIAGMMQLMASRTAAELERKRSEQALMVREQEFRTLVENSPDFITRFDQECRRTYINPSLGEILGATAPLGKRPTEFYRNDTRAVEYEACIRRVLENGTECSYLSTFLGQDGREYKSDIRIVPERNVNGEIIGVLAIGRDIGERLRLEDELQRQASYDLLTGLPNRRLFGDRLQEEIAKAGRSADNVALLFIDLDRFKEVNDTLGHGVGDQLLVEAARRIHACVRESDTVARLGGDEFVTILSGVADLTHLGSVAQSIVDAIAQPFMLDEHLAYISASVGIAAYPQDAGDADALVSCADQAMYAAKEQGRNSFSFFTASMQAQAEIRLRLSTDLRGALAGGQLQVHYQPILDITTGRVDKAEALLRWQHPIHGMVPPDQFIPLAEETGLIHNLGDWVFREAAKMAGRWREQRGGTCVQVSVNISPRQFVRDQICASWIDHLTETGLPAACMAIEITEGLLLSDQADIMDKLGQLREAGIRVALDDFGTGYSAMAYLKKFPIDYLKIDRSFVRDLATDENDRAIAEAIVVMARKLGLKTIAEGVETAEQRDLLAAVGCEYVQGYFYAKPMPEDAFLHYVAQADTELID